MMLNTLEDIFPGIRERVLWTDISNPGTIDKLFGEDGNIIGIGQVLGQMGADRPPMIDPTVKNLYHCCADTGLHGIGGELAADSALNLFELLSG